MAKTQTPTKKRRAGKIILLIANILLLLGLAGFGGYYFYKYDQLKKKPAESVQKAQEAAVKQIVKDVGDRVELPKDEQPTIYTVEDKTKLAGQEFFAKAENGDKALIYSAAKIAILYRPSTKKVINVGPISIAQSITPTVAIIGDKDARDAMETHHMVTRRAGFDAAGAREIAGDEPADAAAVRSTKHGREIRRLESQLLALG